MGYEYTLYNASEGQGSLMICAIIYEPDTGGAPRDFTLSSTTFNGTASKLKSNFVV